MSENRKKEEQRLVVKIFCTLLGIFILLGVLVGAACSVPVEEEVSGTITSKYTVLEECNVGAIRSTSEGYYLKIKSGDLEGDTMVPEDIYKAVSKGDSVKVLALYDRVTNEFEGFDDVKYIMYEE